MSRPIIVFVLALCSYSCRSAHKHDPHDRQRFRAYSIFKNPKGREMYVPCKYVGHDEFICGGDNGSVEWQK